MDELGIPSDEFIRTTELRHVGQQRFDNDQANTFAREMPTYTLADAKIEQALARRWQLALEVRNLFDKRYFSYATATGANSFSALPAPGRARTY